MNRICLILLLSLINSSLNAQPTERNEDFLQSCRISFKNAKLDSDLTSAVVQVCLDRFPMRLVNATASEKEKKEAAVENQSNCALKCINDKLNVTTPSGKVDIGKILSHFQNSNATSKYVEKLGLLLGACEKETEQKVGMRDEGERCKYHVQFMHCYRDSYLAHRSEINEACKA